MSIHPSAVVSPKAIIGAEVTIGPFAIIEKDTEIGDHCVIEGAVQVRAGSRIGTGTFVGAGSIIGSDPQFRGFDPRIPSGTILGERNVLREYVTFHRSVTEGGNTIVGDGNYLMAGSHIGHDSIVGNENTLANNVLLGGHVILGNQCFIGGGSAFHQFVRIGDHVMCQGNSGFSQDLPPFVVGADINTVVGINVVGLKRAGYSPEDRKEIKSAFREIYHSPRTLESILQEVGDQALSKPLQKFYQFFREKSKKGVCVRTSRRREKLKIS